jgi:CBS domain-containing protein
MTQHRTLPLKAFNKDTIAFGPRNEPWQVDLMDPAATVMTDFRDHSLFKVDADENVDEALQQMKHAGLRAAFVMDKESGRVLGMITAYDIMGEKPLRYLQSVGFTDHGVTHRDIRVGDIMEKVEDWTIAEMHQVVQATVQSVLEALQKSGRTHLPVMETKEGSEPRLRGLFSSSKVLRLTGDSRKHALPRSSRASS